MSRRPLAAAFIVSLVALGVAGCGSKNENSADDFKGDQQQVAKVIDSLEKASAGRRTPDAKKICKELITPGLAKEIASQEQGKDCDNRVKDSLEDRNDAGGVATLEVKKVTIAGDQAVASVKDEAGNDEQMSNYTLVRSGNSWRISSF